MVGFLILKHLRNISDESIVEQWSENVYCQYFCGFQEFVSLPPCDSSELVHFRKRIGESGMELILKESIGVNCDDSDEPHESVYTTLQEKNKSDHRLVSKFYKGLIGNSINILLSAAAYNFKRMMNKM